MSLGTRVHACVLGQLGGVSAFSRTVMDAQWKHTWSLSYVLLNGTLVESNTATLKIKLRIYKQRWILLELVEWPLKINKLIKDWMLHPLQLLEVECWFGCRVTKLMFPIHQSLFQGPASSSVCVLCLTHFLNPSSPPLFWSTQVAAKGRLIKKRNTGCCTNVVTKKKKEKNLRQHRQKQTHTVNTRNSFNIQRSIH